MNWRIYMVKNLSIIILTLTFCFASNAQPNYPYLQKQGTATCLIVKDKPFLILGGELGNSSATSPEYMKPIWPKLKALNINTVLLPILWELIEEVENEFQFALVDSLIVEARKNNLKVIILWFGSWKNSMSCYAPGWVKTNQERFPRVKDDKGRSHEILTPFSENNLHADLKAFTKLMEHIKNFDQNENTVIMIQVENEIGMLPTARDYHPLANQVFEANVPNDLMQYLQKNKNNISKELLASWEKSGYKSSGSWEKVFGKGINTDEFFMAYYYSKFTNKVIEAGKAVYPLPMFVNAALNRPGRIAGSGYPSAGPLPHVIDFWKAAGPAIDFYSPDFYTTRFKHWCDLYTRNGNPLFIPEHKFDDTVAPKAFYAIGHYQAMGFCPFSIESGDEKQIEPLKKTYNLLAQLSPIITASQGLGNMDGVLLDKENPSTSFNIGKYEFTVTHSHTFGWSPVSAEDVWPLAGAVIVQTADNEFFFTGTGIAITFKVFGNEDLNVDILKAEEGKFVDGQWRVIRRLNGDQTHQGRHVRIFIGEYGIQKFQLYEYK